MSELKERIKNYIEKSQFPLLYVAVITIIFYMVGLVQIGSNHAPETGMKFALFNSDAEAVSLSLSEETEVSKILCFTGESSGGHVSVTFDSKADDRGQAKLSSAFTWNEVSIGKKVKQINLVFDNAYIREIAIVNGKGEVVIPDNYLDYPKLFDEQSKLSFPSTYYDQMMFDEVFHGRAAYEIINKTSILEKTHPPLGKIIISLGIRAFGMNPFGWRIVSLVFGTVLVFLICAFCYKLTENKNVTILSGILLATEFMHYTLSRIATIDIIVAFFIMLMFYEITAYIKDKNIINIYAFALAAGCGIATKWTALYALFGAFIIYLVVMFGDNKNNWSRKILAGLLCFIVIPLAIYVLSYLPYVKIYPGKNIFMHAIENGKYMLTYHKGMNLAHPYASKWYEWLVDLVPVVDAYRSIGTKASTVVTFFNPVICIVGAAAIILNVCLLVKRRDKYSGLLLFMYIVMLAPWMVITRTAFIYQYFVCMLITIALAGYGLSSLKLKYERFIVISLCVISIVLFCIYFPVISGVPANKSYISALELLPRWIL